MVERKPLGIGIVGIGYGQNVLLPAFRAAVDAEVVAIGASSVERARAVAESAHIPLAFGAWEDLVGHPAVAVVAVAVPPVLQPEIIRLALRHKKHVFCEKPVGMDASIAWELVEQARLADVRHVVDFEFAELEAWRRARALITENHLGTLRSFHMAWHVETRANRLSVDSWKTDVARGGGALSSFGSHSLFLVEWLLGPITGLMARIGPDADTADTRVNAVFELTNAVTGSLSIATDAVAGSGHRVEVHFSDGSLRLENCTMDHLRNFVLTVRRRGHDPAIVVDERGDEHGDPRPPDGRLLPVGNLVHRFLGAVRTGETVTPNLCDGARVQTLLGLVREASRSGRWLTLET